MISPSDSGTACAQTTEVELLGYSVERLSRTAILETLCGRFDDRRTVHVVTLNTEMIIASHRDREMYKLLLAGDMFVADGVGLIGAARLLRRPRVHRYPGVDLAFDLMQALAERGGSVYLLGAGPGVAADAAVRLAKELPGLKVAGYADGYFKLDAEGEIVAGIAALKPDLLLVGMGCPKQESFIVRNRDRLGVPVMIGVGGALEVFAGRKVRAPRWMQKSGTEWIYRTLQDFKRISRLPMLAAFIGLVFRESMGRAARD